MSTGRPPGTNSELGTTTRNPPPFLRKFGAQRATAQTDLGELDVERRLLMRRISAGHRCYGLLSLHLPRPPRMFAGAAWRATCGYLWRVPEPALPSRVSIAGP